MAAGSAVTRGGRFACRALAACASLALLAGGPTRVPPASAQERPAAADPRLRADPSRTVLALFDSSEGGVRDERGHHTGGYREDYNQITQNAALPLNHLGLTLVYHDIHAGIPSDALTAGCGYVLTWFTDNAMRDPERYIAWLTRVVDAGKPVAIFEDFGFEARWAQGGGWGGNLDPTQYAALLKKLGIALGQVDSTNPFRISIASADPVMVEFERRLKYETYSFQEVSALPERNPTVHLRLLLDGGPTAADCVFTNDRGGYAQGGYIIQEDTTTWVRRWRLDPFRFFTRAFRLGAAPVFDTTTASGSRIFFAHVDGDGFRNGSTASRPPGWIQWTCGDVILGQIIQDRNLPLTVSFIGAELDPESTLSDDHARVLARDILKQDNVEAAVHGYCHPIDWRQPDDFAFKLLRGKPWTNASELQRPVSLVDALCPKGKRTLVYLWTGLCNPPEDALRFVRNMGLVNMNGGDTQFDPLLPSYTGVAPLTRAAGNELQVHTGAANEILFTNGWAGPYHGFRNVRMTFVNTDFRDPARDALIPENSWVVARAGDRRVAPINIYYHFYSADRPAAISALHDIYDFAGHFRTCPVFATDYIRVVEDFHTARAEPTLRRVPGAGSRWRFTRYGACRTVRFDAADGMPDMATARNVMGFRTEAGGRVLYVHLGPDTDGLGAEVELAQAVPGDVRLTRHLRLDSAPGIVESFAITPGSGRFTFRGFADGSAIFAGLVPAARYRVTLTAAGADPVTRIETASVLGRIETAVSLQSRLTVAIAPEAPK